MAGISTQTPACPQSPRTAGLAAEGALSLQASSGPGPLLLRAPGENCLAGGQWEGLNLDLGRSVP